MTKQKPNLTFWQLWNLSFAYLGIQIGYSLQGTQMSGIFTALGAPDQNLAILWLGGPLAGLLVQPIIGLFSDKTWIKGLGRRIPFLLAGGILAALMMVLIVNTKVLAGNFLTGILWGVPTIAVLAAVFFLLKDCAFNVSMHPLRALQGDMVNEEQRNKGFGIQNVLLNIGAIIGFALPFMFTSAIDWLGWENAKIGGIEMSLSMSYYVGAAILLLGVLWTTFRVKEYPSKEFAEYNGITEEASKKKESFWTILKTTPTVMFQLAIVQFFTWMALFCIWTYGLNAVAENVFGVQRVLVDGNMVMDTSSGSNFNEARNWWGVANAVMALFALAFSFLWPALANKFGRKSVYSFGLLMGAIGLVSIFFIRHSDPNAFNSAKYILFFSMAGWGIATAVINAIPFAIVCAKVPKEKMGVYMGVFNLSIVIPQIAFSLGGGLLFKLAVGDSGSNVMMMIVAGILFVLAAIAVVFVKDKDVVATPSL
ncbi:MAG: MFS transporter [Prevotellaceae bacterium]|jgi:maltose/moltooligosaccharide transporter|nr:MFS transporter [Prevotellaceae bacterium]